MEDILKELEEKKEKEFEFSQFLVLRLQDPDQFFSGEFLGTLFKIFKEKTELLDFCNFDVFPVLLRNHIQYDIPNEYFELIAEKTSAREVFTILADHIRQHGHSISPKHVDMIVNLFRISLVRIVSPKRWRFFQPLFPILYVVTEMNLKPPRVDFSRREDLEKAANEMVVRDNKFVHFIDSLVKFIVVMIEPFSVFKDHEDLLSQPVEFLREYMFLMQFSLLLLARLYSLPHSENKFPYEEQVKSIFDAIGSTKTPLLYFTGYDGRYREYMRVKNKRELETVSETFFDETDSEDEDEEENVGGDSKEADMFIPWSMTGIGVFLYNIFSMNHDSHTQYTHLFYRTSHKYLLSVPYINALLQCGFPNLGKTGLLFLRHYVRSIKTSTIRLEIVGKKEQMKRAFAEESEKKKREIRKKMKGTGDSSEQEGEFELPEEEEENARPNVGEDLLGDSETEFEVYVGNFQSIMNFMAGCPDDPTRSIAYDIFSIFLSKFEDRGRLALLERLSLSCPYPSMLGLLITRIKEEICLEYNSVIVEMGGSKKCFKPMLLSPPTEDENKEEEEEDQKIPLALPDLPPIVEYHNENILRELKLRTSGSEFLKSEVLEFVIGILQKYIDDIALDSMDVLLNGLNLFYFLLLRDSHPNITGITKPKLYNLLKEKVTEKLRIRLQQLIDRVEKQEKREGIFHSTQVKPKIEVDEEVEGEEVSDDESSKKVEIVNKEREGEEEFSDDDDDDVDFSVLTDEELRECGLDEEEIRLVREEQKKKEEENKVKFSDMEMEHVNQMNPGQRRFLKLRTCILQDVLNNILKIFEILEEKNPKLRKKKKKKKNDDEEGETEEAGEK